MVTTLTKCEISMHLQGNVEDDRTWSGNKYWKKGLIRCEDRGVERQQLHAARPVFCITDVSIHSFDCPVSLANSQKNKHLVCNVSSVAVRQTGPDLIYKVDFPSKCIWSILRMRRFKHTKSVKKNKTFQWKAIFFVSLLGNEKQLLFNWQWIDPSPSKLLGRRVSIAPQQPLPVLSVSHFLPRNTVRGRTANPPSAALQYSPSCLSSQAN